MPAQSVVAGPSRQRPALSIVAVLLLIAFVGALAVPAHAADDSNAGQLSQTPTLSSQQLSSALNTLSQGTNDTQLQQLLSEFQTQMNGGNYSGAASTLSRLQGLSSNQQGGASPALEALLQSLSVGSDGASVNANTLAGLLTSASSSPAGSQQKLSVDMQTLASLLQYANSTLASQLLQNSSLLSQGAFGLGIGASAGGASVGLPSVSKLPGLSVPSLGAPSLSVGASPGGLPSIPLADFLVPLVAAAAVAALFFSRGRIARVVGAQSLPGMTILRGAKDEGGDGEATPADPRGRIELYFRRAARLMARRGVPKLESETHREFSSKCEATPERPHVRTISSLYEKAKFSGESVGSADADLAASELLAMGSDER